MHTLVLIRHAIAEDRETWTGDDDAQRPLTPAGRSQAKRIARAVLDLLHGEGAGKRKDDADRAMNIASLKSSPALRCVDTVKPLAKRLQMEIEVDGRLMEGSAIAPPSPRDAGAHVLCAHGDNIPWLLDDLKIDWDGRCKKGSIWVIQRDAAGRVVDARYEAVRKD